MRSYILSRKVQEDKITSNIVSSDIFVYVVCNSVSILEIFYTSCILAYKKKKINEKQNARRRSCFTLLIIEVLKLVRECREDIQGHRSDRIRATWIDISIVSTHLYLGRDCIVSMERIVWTSYRREASGNQSAFAVAVPYQRFPPPSRGA